MKGLFKDSGIISRERMMDKIKRLGRIRDEYTKGKIVYLPNNGLIVIIGDLHGDFEAVVSIVRQVGFLKAVNRGKNIFLVFLGDYGDRGKKSVETINEVMSLRLAYPQNVFLLKGNHEERDIALRHGVYSDFDRAWGKWECKPLFEIYCRVMGGLPVVVKTANGIIGVHGGIPNNDIKSLDCLNRRGGNQIAREMIWNGPSSYAEERKESKRGEEFTVFGESNFNIFMEASKASVMIRSHEKIANGFYLMFHNRLATIFSNGSVRSKSSHYRREVYNPVFFFADLNKEIEYLKKEHFITVEYF